MHSLKIKSLIASALLAVAGIAAAHSFNVGKIDIDHPNARPTRAGQSVGVGYLKITNRGAADRLLLGSTPVAAAVEMHSMAMDGDVMRMRQVDAIELPSGAVVELQPGGYHLMLTGLKAPLAAGSKFALTLNFEKAGSVVVVVHVEAAQPAGAVDATVPGRSAASAPTAGHDHSKMHQH